MAPFLRRLLSAAGAPGKEVHAWLQAERRIVDALASADGLAAAAQDVLDALGTALRWTFGALWVPDAAGERLRCIGAWSAAGARRRTLEEQTLARALTPGRGPAGLAWQRKEALAFPDLTKGDPPPGTEEVRAAGLKGALAFPILHGAAFYGAVELYDESPSPEDEDLLLAASNLGKHLGQFATRQRALRELSAGEAALQDLFDHAPVAIHSADVHGRIVRANAAELALLGYPAERYLGRPWRDVHVDPGAADRLLARLARGETVADEDVRLRRADGAERWVRVHATGQRREGTLVQVRTYSRDVTDERRDQEALRTIERRFLGFVEGVRDCAIVTLDPDGRVTSWNPGAERVFGFATAEMLGQGLERTFLEEDRRDGAPARHVRLALDEGEFRHEGWRVRGAGGRFWAEVAMTCVHDAQGAPVEVMVLVRDLSERRRLEDVRRRTAELEAANRAVVLDDRRHEAALTAVGRALERPAAAVSAAAEVLRIAASDGRPAKEGDVEALLRSVGELERTLADLTRDAAEAARRIDLEPERWDPLRLAMDTCDLLRGDAHARLVHLEVDVDPGLTELVTDPTRFRQVLFGLVANALHATRDRGRVVVRLRPEGPADVRVEVEDTGIGLSPDELARAYEPAPEGADAEEARRRLGLAAARRIVEQQGGRVGAQSTLGRGSVFFAVLPRRPAAPAPAPAEPARGLVVLVVTPQVPLRASLSWTLGGAGHEVLTAEDAAGALALARDRALDGVALDLGQPGLDPVDLALQLRSGGASRGLPCVLAVVTGEGGAPAVLAVSDLVPRPCPADRLFPALERLRVPRGKERPVLVVDADLDALRATEKAVNLLGYRAAAEPDADAALRLCAEDPPSAVVLAPFVLGMNPFAFHAHLVRARNGSPVPLLLCLPRDLADGPLLERLRDLATEALALPAFDPRAFLEALVALRAR